jgi:hypothetical protein
MSAADHPPTVTVPSKAPRCAAALALAAYGTARADLASIAALRRTIPAWAPADTPGHFLKHADEQTVVAVAAVDRAIAASGEDVSAYRNFAIIAAPRFVGRIAGAETLARFQAGGGPSVSPHTIPQHSLHSISGALSILLASREPNFGVGGIATALAEGLLAALTLPAPTARGIWLVATAFEPEPKLEASGRCLNEPAVCAAALAFRPIATAQCKGRLWLERSIPCRTQPGESADGGGAPSVTELIALLAAAAERGGVGGCQRGSLRWRFPGGATVIFEAHAKLEASAPASGLAAAA